MNNKILLILTIFSLAGCSKNFKKTVGLTENLPDEYQAVKNQPLEVPPHYQIKKPMNTNN
jgi:uncharacterized lipoprotein